MSHETEPRKPLPQHYYVTEIEECPVCGRERKTKYRVYGEPKDESDRHDYQQSYDWCLEGMLF